MNFFKLIDIDVLHLILCVFIICLGIVLYAGGHVIMFNKIIVKVSLKKSVILGIVFSFVFMILVHGLMFLDMDNRANNILDYILDNNAKIDFTNIDLLPGIGFVSEKFNFVNITYPVRYFYAVYNEWGKLIDLNVDRCPEMNYTLAENLISNFNSNISCSGYDGTYKYKIMDIDSEKLLVYLDQSINLYSILLSLFVSSLLLLIFFMFVIFTGKNTKNVSSINIKRSSFKSPGIYLAESNKMNEVHVFANEGDTNTGEISIFSENGMNKIVAQLLLLSNLNMKDWLKPFEKFNFSDVVLETVFSFQTIEEVKQKQIEINIHRNIIIDGNKKYLKKCIELLIDNSIKYSDDNGNIIISLESVRGEVRLSIKNSCDIDALGNLELLFQPFYRRSCQFSNSGCNFGMGLAVAKKIVDAHNAQIFVYGEENFIEFTVLFPNTI